MVHHWNSIAMDAIGLDHTPATPGEDRTAGEELGPGGSSRSMAIVQIAIFEAVNSIAGKYRPYTGMPFASQAASMDAAISQAAHDALNYVLPSQAHHCDAQLADDLAQIPDGQLKLSGMEIGRQAAAGIIAMRAGTVRRIANPC